MGAQVSREPPPPLPGGYTVGEQVYFTGAGKTFASGDRLEHGKQGEVMGPATGETHQGKGVKVRFPGNKRAIKCYLARSCYLTEVRRRRRGPRSHPQLPAAPQLPLLPAHARYVMCGRTGTVTSLADAQFDTGRQEAPESTIGGQTTCTSASPTPSRTSRYHAVTSAPVVLARPK